MTIINKLVISILTISCLIHTGCANFQLVEVETVRGKEHYVGVIEQSTLNYNPIKIVRYPTEDDLRLSTYLEKKIEIKQQYQRLIYQQNVYERPRESFEDWFEISSKIMEDNPIMGTISWALTPVFATMDTLSGAYVSPEVKKEKVPNSDSIVYYTKTKQNTIPASNELIKVQDNLYYTNEKGIINHKCSPNDLSDGIFISTPNHDKAYIAKRSKHEREVTASWKSTARGASRGLNIASTTYDIYKGYKKIKMATSAVSAIGGIAGIAARLAVGYVVEKIVDMVIDHSSKSIETYYKWTLYELK